MNVDWFVLDALLTDKCQALHLLAHAPYPLAPRPSRSRYWNKLLGREETFRSIGTDVKYWESPERSGWLMKQGEFLSSWRRRYFVLKDGHLFWFLGDYVTKDVLPRGVVRIDQCLSIKCAEEAVHKPYAFEISTGETCMFFVAESEREKEEWINSVGRAIIRHSRCVLPEERVNYT